MGIYNNLPEGIKEVDVVIAGGGTAGCVVAGRLADADPNLSILVIEGGTNSFDVPSVVRPVLFLSNLAANSKTAIFYRGNKAPSLADREPIVPSGGVLGGGSSINFMMYSRAQRDDFDSWNTPGWSADELLPSLKKLETYHGANGDPSRHGSDGPVQVSDGGYRPARPMKDLLTAAAKVGYPEIRDLQDLDSDNGFSRAWRTVSPDGRRQDSAHTFLHPRLQDGQHPNLHVLVETKVVRVLVDDNKRACGVEFMPNPDYQVATLTHESKHTVLARKLVVVSCGACGTPGVLERSGIGSREVLQRAGVAVVADVPGVGRDYQDHHLVFLPYRTSLEPHETLDAILSGRLPLEVAVAEHNKILGWNSIDVAAKTRPTDAEVAALGPDFQAAWDRDFRDYPNRPLMLMGLVSTYLGDHTSIAPGQYVSFANYTAYPYSRGHIHITGPELADRLDFDVGFLTDAHDIDLKKQVWAYKKQREIMRRTNMYRGEVAIGHPTFPPNSKAACVELEDHDPENIIRDIEYSAEDDKAIEMFLRENINTTWHSLGTVKMAAREEMGAVDASLNVYGVQGLKVVDLSIPPKNVASNTNNTAFVIGEKGADIIIRELGLVRG